MNQIQIELARHAIGLPNKRRVSYRNHFCAGPGHSDYDQWMGIVEEGLAWKRKGSQLSGGDDIFHLTTEGATASLKRGEKLDPDDFPIAISAARLAE